MILIEKETQKRVFVEETKGTFNDVICTLERISDKFDHFRPFWSDEFYKEIGMVPSIENTLIYGLVFTNVTPNDAEETWIEFYLDPECKEE